MITGSVLAQFTITLSQAVSEPVEVEWYTSDGTGLAGVDYAANKGVVIFAPGQTAKTVDILVYGRAVGSEDRSFFVEMLPPVNAILGASIGECIIHVDTTGSTPVTQIIVPTGPQGPEGKSAYQTWLDLGNTGTEQDFIDSLSPSPEEIAEDVAPLIDVGDTVLTAEGTEGLSKPDATTVKAVARRVAYVGAARIATVVLADGDNLVAQSDLTGDTVDMGSIGLYPRIMRGTSVLSPQWSVEADGRLLIKGAVAGDVLYVCQYDVASGPAVTRLSFEALRRSYAEASYNLIGRFSNTGLSVNSVTDVVLWEPTGIAYAYSGTLPHTIGASENPVGNPLWVAKDADSFRGQVAAPDGSSKVGFQQSGVGTIPRTSLDKQREIINAADYGVIGGLPDETVNLQKAFEAALLRNGILEFNPGVYNYTTLKVTANDTSKHIMLYARGKVTFNCIKTTPDTSNYDADYAIKLMGFFQTEVSLTADGNINTGLLTLSSVAGINPDDLLEVKSSRLIQTDSRGNAREGQLVRVNSVNAPLSRVGLDVPLEYYAPASRVTPGTIASVTSTTQLILSGVNLPEREAMVSFRFTSGALNGQARFVTAWDNVTKVAKFDGDQAAWPAGAAPGDAFSLVWETKVSVIKPITARVVGDFHFTRALHTGAAPGDVGFRGLDIVYGDTPIVSGVTVKRFSETGIRFRSCFRPIIRDSTVTDANRAYNVFDGTGYGVSFNQCFEGIADNVGTYRCRKGIDIIGAQHISWRTRIVNCNDSGGGVDYVGNAFWPTGPTENTGLGSHGSGYGTLYSNCQVADKFLGWGCRGLEETIQNCQHRGYGESCVRYWYGGGLTVDGFTYNDRFSEIGRDASNRYMISGDPESRCLQFMEVYTDSRSYIQTLPLTIKNVAARKLRLAFIQFFGVGTSGTMYNLTLGDNVVWASPEGGTNVEFTFVRCEDTKQMFNFQNLGGNRYSFDGAEYTTFYQMNIGQDQVMPVGTYARLAEFLWTAVIADDTVIKIPVGNSGDMATMTIHDRTRDRNYRAVNMILATDRAVDYSPSQATNKTGIQLSNAVLTGTTGTDGQVTISYRPGTSGADNRYLFIENRSGVELRPVINLVSIQ